MGKRSTVQCFIQTPDFFGGGGGMDLAGREEILFNAQICVSARFFVGGGGGEL